MLPIVMGAPRADYGKVAPSHAYIHVDDFSGPRQLASYLHRLAHDDTQFGEYFRWTRTLSIAPYKHNARFWCRVCTLLHYQVTPTEKKTFSADLNV